MSNRKFVISISILAVIFLAAAITMIFMLKTGQEASPKSPGSLTISTDVDSDKLNSDEIYNLVNEQRLNANVPALEHTPQLNDSALDKCSDMIKDNYYDHINPTTRKHGYEYVFEHIANVEVAAENLAGGQYPTNDGIMKGWLSSPAHKAAMLDPQYTKTGIATCTKPDGEVLIVEHFAKMLSVQVQQSPVTEQDANRGRFIPPSTVTCTTGQNYQYYGDTSVTTVCL